MGWGRQGVLPRGVRSQAQSIRSAGLGVSREAEALSAVLKTRRAGGEGRGTRGARRCAGPGPQGTQGRRGPSPTRPRARSPCPAQNRSARTAAERMAIPRRRAAGGLGPGTAGTLARAGWTGGLGAGCGGAGADWGRRSQLSRLRPSVCPPTSLSSLGSGTAGIYKPPAPEMTSSGPPLPPFSHPSGVRPQLAPPLVSRLSLLVSASQRSWVWLRGGYLASRRWQGASADPPPLEVSTDLLSVGKSFSVSGPRVPPMYTEVPTSSRAPLHAPEVPSAGTPLP